MVDYCEQVFYDDVQRNNKIGTKKVVTNIKHHLGLKGRNLESLPRTQVGQVKSSQSALRENSPITNAEEGTIN